MIIIALGANLPSEFGTPEQSVRRAAGRLEELGLRVVAGSALWESAPVPASDQPHYINGVVAVETDLSPEALLQTLHGLEHAFGRSRASEPVRNMARAMDLDLIAYHDWMQNESDCVLPHPQMHLRRFVLEPLNQIAPTWSHPVFRKTVGQLLDELPQDDAEMRLIEGGRLYG